MWPGACAAIIRDLLDRIKAGVPGERYGDITLASTQSGGGRSSPSSSTNRRGEQLTNGTRYDFATDAMQGQSTDSGGLEFVSSEAYDPSGSNNLAGILQANGLEPSSILDSSNIDLFQGFEIPFWIEDDQYPNSSAWP